MSTKNTISTQAVKAILKGLLKQTESASRITRVKSHLKEVEAAHKQGADLTSTRVGNVIQAFKNANKRRVLNEEVITDFLYTRMLNSGKGISATKRLEEAKLKFSPSEIGRITAIEA